MSEESLESPVPDAEEQRRDLTEDPEKGPPEEPTSLPPEVNEADAVEQHREVETDEDDYR
jgi:hypothetical protein